MPSTRLAIGLAQFPQFCLQHLNALVAPGERGHHVSGVETLGNMLRAVLVPGGNGEQDDLFGSRTVTVGHQLCDQVRVVFDNAGFAPNLNASPMHIVDKKKMGLGIIRKIALRDVLSVTGKIDKSDRLLVEYPQESRGSAAVLDIGLPCRVNGRNEDACLRFDEENEISGDTGLPRALSLHAFVGAARALAGLRCFDGWRESDVAWIIAVAVHHFLLVLGVVRRIDVSYRPRSDAVDLPDGLLAGPHEVMRPWRHDGDAARGQGS